MKINNFLKLIIVVGVSEFAGIIGSIFAVLSIQTWYAGLAKPALNPPSWIFGPVWTILYFLMGVAAFLVWRKGTEREEVKVALGIFCVQLFLNAIWPIIFFGLRSPSWAFIEIIILWLAIIWTTIVFFKICRPAAFLFLPYILWVSFAGYLNFAIWQLQTSVPEPVACAMDAKLCPDGSYVARILPECDFALCPETKTVKLYYYNPELDKNESGNIACSRNGLISIKREIPITQTPIQDTIRLLLSGNLTNEERVQGIKTEYPLDGFSLKGASLNNGVLTLEFNDSQNKTVGGSCRVGIFWFQIEATAKQFPEVSQVRFLPEESFQP